MAELTEDQAMAKKKVEHGGKRPGAGRPSTGRDDATAKLARSIISQAKAIAHYRGISVAEYLSDKFADAVSKDYGKMLREIEAKESKEPK